MSFEGSEIWICEDGHMFEFDVYCSPNQATWVCPNCGKKYANMQIIDETNGLPYHVDFKIEEIKPGKYQMSDTEPYYWTGKYPIHPDNGHEDYKKAYREVYGDLNDF